MNDDRGLVADGPVGAATSADESDEIDPGEDRLDATLALLASETVFSSRHREVAEALLPSIAVDDSAGIIALAQLHATLALVEIAEYQARFLRAADT